MTLMRAIFVYRSAVSGRFVSKAYAEAHPDTTIMQQVRVVKVKK